MSFLDKLEKPLGSLAVPGLIRYIVALNALVFLLVTLNPPYLGLLTLDRQAILDGQVWRLLSWIFIPNTFSFLWVLFYLMFTWWMGDLIESTWGTFRLNVYYVVGYLGCTASALIFGQSLGNIALNSSLLFAAGTLAPELQIMLFGVIPLRLKWVAMISAVLLLVGVVTADWGARFAVLVAFSNYFLFFGPTFFRQISTNRENASRREKFESAKLPETESLHRCEVCGRTERSNPELDFRVSADGHEYCTAHLPRRTD
ncbi:MAG TPA: hypothetical protein VIM61_15070 [Chthoniobacterales bacterium]|jgi:hypothetical protein